ncbi:hypothetical protein SDC9_68405 [bioreactor metagenome]|uniref:Uncharacterized protein n=1 Tax=bioreactor metagenome TaxID=1076179 RepID=A0A644Y0B7_9ZZZZ
MHTVLFNLLTKRFFLFVTHTNIANIVDFLQNEAKRMISPVDVNTITKSDKNFQENS